MYTAASGGAAASYEAVALPKEQNDPKLSLHAQSAVLMDGLTGRILYGKMRMISALWPVRLRL